ncbi:MAG: hypothetical protein NC432_13575 [Roseburia sp.]|nr:hypothetical protein [Roseburia sp.]MCM1098787.1 hypothetical protein [Ruminococcus flavefaciens]
MYHYSVLQWLFFFYFYCFAGWCFESAFVSIKSRKLTNRGFMRGPFLPIYGSGAIMMLVVSMPFQDSILLTYVAGCVGATALEYVTGVLMEKLFKVRYWDYSEQRFNFQGHICLGSSLAWGFFTILMTEVIQVRVERLVFMIPGQALTVVTLVLTAGIFSDFALSFKAAIDLRELLIKMERAKEELEHIQKRLNDIAAAAEAGLENRADAFAESVSTARDVLAESVGTAKNALAESVSTAKDEFKGSVAELKNNIENKLEGIVSSAKAKPSEYFESVKEELLELRVRYLQNLAEGKRIREEKNFFRNDLIRSNPGMTSVKYKEALEELKNQIRGKKSGK